MPLTFLSNEGSVKIPFFQRSYVWNSSNWEDLLEDLLDSGKSHFLGSLILKQLEKQTGKTKEVLVIDGQQRLTTLSILLRTLYNSFDDTIKNNCEPAINNNLYYKKTPTDAEQHIKITHSKIDADYYKKVINNEISEKEYNDIIIEDESNKIQSSDNRIFQCYKFFSEKLKSIDQSEKQDLFNRLLDNENKMLVLIDLTEKEDEQAIFDTINSAGIRLSGADIIKNALFQKALDLYDNQDEVIKLYKESWENIFSKDDETLEFWDAQRSTGRLMRDNIEILLHSISVIKGFFDPDKHTLSDLSVLYKTYIKTLDKTGLTDFINEISKYADLYRDKILVFNNSSLFSFKDDYARLFHVLSITEISTFHPYILYLFNKHESDGEMLKSELYKIEKYIIRRMITKKAVKSYNKICKEFIVNNSAIDTKLNEISNDEVIEGLQNIKNKNAALLLFWIELKRRNDDVKQSVKELKYNYSLEHILPQSWEEHWSTVPVYDEKNAIIGNSDEAKKVRYKKLLSIGNMTLLNSRLNSSLRNYKFERKVEGEGRKRGIRDYSDLWITKEDITENYNKGQKTWDERRINERTKNLSQEILNIW